MFYYVMQSRTHPAIILRGRAQSCYLLSSQEEKELVAWQRARMQLNPGRTRHLQTFKDMQKNSEPFKNVNSYILIGASPRKKSECAQGVQTVKGQDRQVGSRDL